MSKTYIFIDYENVQPKNLSPLYRSEFHIRIFLGANQRKLETIVAEALQPFGQNAEYIQITGNGKNAADFHIAYYLGQYAQEADVSFYVVTKDKGFDPLIKHLVEKNITAKRVGEINKIPVLRQYSENSTDGKVEKIISNLKSRGQSVPKREKTLRSSINALFGQTLRDEELTNIVGRMQNLNHLKIDEGKVRYYFN